MNIVIQKTRDIYYKTTAQEILDDMDSADLDYGKWLL